MTPRKEWTQLVEWVRESSPAELDRLRRLFSHGVQRPTLTVGFCDCGIEAFSYVPKCDCCREPADVFDCHNCGRRGEYVQLWSPERNAS